MNDQYHYQSSGHHPSNDVAGAGNVAGNAPNLDFITSDNREKEYRQAVKHSNKVRFWKVALPVLAILIILGISIALVVRSFSNSDAIVEGINVSNGKLVMENPQLNGVDKNKRPYNLSATRAVQDISNPARVELQKILAELPMDDKTTATITAGMGVYDAEAKTLILNEQINVTTTSGMALFLQDASIDIGNSSMQTTNPISATSPQADISALSLQVEEGGNRLLFEGKVRMTLRPDGSKTGEANNDDN